MKYERVPENRRRIDLLDAVHIPPPAGRAGDEIARVLRAWIVTEAAPGDFLPTERLLVERFGVSRPTIRVAMRSLEAEGLVEIRRGMHGGAIVREPDVHGLATSVGALLQRIGATVAEVFTLRLMLEPEAARRVAAREDGAIVAAALDAALAAERGTIRGDEPDAVSRRNVEFHNVVLALSQDRVLATFGELLESVIVQQNTRSLEKADSPRLRADDAHQAHRRIVSAIKRGDADAAARLMRKHLEASCAFVIGTEPDLAVDVVTPPGEVALAPVLEIESKPTAATRLAPRKRAAPDGKGS